MRFRQMLPFLRFAPNEQSFGRQGASPLQVKPRIIFSRYIQWPAAVFFPLLIIRKSTGITFFLLGLYAFGLFTKWQVKDTYVPIVAVLTPFVGYAVDHFSNVLFNFEFLFSFCQ